MSIQTVCPQCDRPYTLADQMAGKMIRCKGCASTFRVETEEARRDREAAPLAEEHDPEELDDLEDVAAATSQRRGRKTSKKAAPTSKKKGRPLWPLALGGGVAVMFLALIGCCGVGGFYYLNHFVDPNINEAGYDRLRNGMTEDQVNAILGPPKKSTNQIWTGIGPKIIVAEWTKKDNTIAVEYNDGQAVKITGKFVTNGETHERTAPASGGSTAFPPVTMPVGRPR